VPFLALVTGVEGIGSEDSPLALYEDADGDRGILADQVGGQATAATWVQMLRV
jgi:hypothetical protein